MTLRPKKPRAVKAWQPKWRPIKSAPKNDVIVLSDGGMLCQGFWNGGNWITGFVSGPVSTFVKFEATHWVPLPKGPIREVKR